MLIKEKIELALGAIIAIVLAFFIYSIVYGAMTLFGIPNNEMWLRVIITLVLLLVLTIYLVKGAADIA